MYQGVCTHTEHEQRVVRMSLVDPKQNPNVCDVRKIVFELIKNPDIKFNKLIFPQNMWYRHRGGIPRIT